MLRYYLHTDVLGLSINLGPKTSKSSCSVKLPTWNVPGRTYLLKASIQEKYFLFHLKTYWCIDVIYYSHLSQKLINLNNAMVSFEEIFANGDKIVVFLIQQSHLSVNHDAKKLYTRGKKCKNHTSTLSCVQLS